MSIMSIFYSVVGTVYRSGQVAHVMIEMLNRVFENFGRGEKYVVWHEDNCAAHNKSYFVIKYREEGIRRQKLSFLMYFIPVGTTSSFQTFD